MLTVAVWWMHVEVRRREKTGYSMLTAFRVKEFVQTACQYYCCMYKKLLRTDTAETAQVKMVTLAMDMLLNVSKFDILTIEGFEMDNALFTVLKDVYCGPLESLNFTDCHYTLQADLFSLFLKTYPPRNLFLDNFVGKMHINDLHLANIPQCVRLSDEGGTYRRHYPDISDQTLINWSYNTPERIYMRYCSTNITLNGVINFIKAIIKKFASDEVVFESYADREDLYSFNEEQEGNRCFDIGIVKSDDDMMRNFIFLQRTQGLSVLMRKKIIVVYKHTRFIFQIQKQVSRITKTQARDELQAFRNRILEIIAMNPDFITFLDDDLVAELHELRDRLHWEWDNLRRTIHFLEYMRGGVNEPEIDGNDEESEEENE